MIALLNALPSHPTVCFCLFYGLLFVSCAISARK